MNQLDLLATPMTDCFTSKPDFSPYNLIPSKIPLDTMNPPLEALSGQALLWAKTSMELPLMDEPDAFPDELGDFKRLFWYAMAGPERPYTYVNDEGKIIFDSKPKKH